MTAEMIKFEKDLMSNPLVQQLLSSMLLKDDIERSLTPKLSTVSDELDS